MCFLKLDIFHGDMVCEMRPTQRKDFVLEARKKSVRTPRPRKFRTFKGRGEAYVIVTKRIEGGISTMWCFHLLLLKWSKFGAERSPSGQAKVNSASSCRRRMRYLKMGCRLSAGLNSRSRKVHRPLQSLLHIQHGIYLRQISFYQVIQHQ